MLIMNLCYYQINVLLENVFRIFCWLIKGRSKCFGDTRYMACLLEDKLKKYKQYKQIWTKVKSPIEMTNIKILNRLKTDFVYNDLVTNERFS